MNGEDHASILNQLSMTVAPNGTHYFRDLRPELGDEAFEKTPKVSLHEVIISIY